MWLVLESLVAFDSLLRLGGLGTILTHQTSTFHCSNAEEYEQASDSGNVFYLADINHLFR